MPGSRRARAEEVAAARSLDDGRDARGYLYAPYWCEENAILLAREIGPDGVFVVFVTNEERMVPLARQRAGEGEEGLALWDYHVFVVDRRASGEPLVVDLDCTLGAPCGARRYLEETFVSLGALTDALPPLFRVVDAAACLASFTSDRRHMRDVDGKLMKPPPPWPCLGDGGSNLAEFLRLDVPTFGTLLDFAGFTRWLLDDDGRVEPV